MLPNLVWLGYSTLPAWLLGAAVLVALAVDRWLGEPPVRWHPVVWMGHYLGWGGRWVQARTRHSASVAPDYKAFWLGALVWIGGAAIVLIVSCTLQQVLLAAAVPLELGQGAWAQIGAGVLAALLLGLLLKPLLSWALLCSEVLAVERALRPAHGGSLASGRERLRWLVSRDVAALTETQVRESVIETLAENFSDSVVAPLFWFVLLGLPGAALFRFANTADAMWGYRGVYQGQNWEWAGKWAARADDVLCWLPARITGLLLLALAPQRWRQLRREAARTPSPNSGWPMAAMALALGLALHKPGVYALNASGCQPQPTDTAAAIRRAQNSLLALVLIAYPAIILIVFLIHHVQ
ncbi:MAG: adenosylcobinamide-phosphate synthase CbiB [Rhodoferax sp.]|nr:adenosylcobinamide-phosphate synthase CbiB [Rhodoferax sp.]